MLKFHYNPLLLVETYSSTVTPCFPLGPLVIWLALTFLVTRLRLALCNPSHFRNYNTWTLDSHPSLPILRLSIDASPTALSKKEDGTSSDEAQPQVQVITLSILLVTLEKWHLFRCSSVAFVCIGLPGTKSHKKCLPIKQFCKKFSCYLV